VSVGLSPLNLIPIAISITSSNVHLNRNLNVASPESTFQDVLNGKIGTSYSPFGFLKLDGGYEQNRMEQYRSPTLNITRQTLIANQGNPKFFLDKLTKTDSTVSLKATFSPFNSLSLIAGAQKRAINQEYTVSVNPVSKQEFNQTVGETGVSLFPLEGLSIANTYKFKLTNGKEGYALNTALAYKPISTPQFQVDISFTRDQVWGKDLNELDRSTVLQGVGNEVAVSIRDVDHVVETGSLTININMPLPEFPYVENFVVTAQGYIKKINDRKDAENKKEGRVENSYDITGLILKGTLNF